MMQIENLLPVDAVVSYLLAIMKKTSLKMIYTWLLKSLLWSFWFYIMSRIVIS